MTIAGSLRDKNRETLNHSARAGSERFFPSRRFRKRWNPVCISRFLNRADGGKDPLPSRRRVVQRFHRKRISARLGKSGNAACGAVLKRQKNAVGEALMIPLQAKRNVFADRQKPMHLPRGIPRLPDEFPDSGLGWDIRSPVSGAREKNRASP